MHKNVRKPCEILVFYDHKQKSHGSSVKNIVPFENAISQAYSTLLETGLYSDLEIVVNGESIRAHKAVLRARSEKF